MTLEEHLMLRIGALLMEQARLAAKVDELTAKLPPAEPKEPA